MAQTRILRLYSPHSAQRAFHSSKARFRVASWGRQSGKSTACLNDLAWRAWCNPGHVYWFVSPTFPQALVQYRRFVGMLLGCPDVLLKKNQTELRVKLINQATVVFKSGEVLDNLRGETLNGVAIDEVRDQNPDLWKLVLRPMLTTTRGWASFVSTPRGYDQFYDFFQRAEVDPDWESFYAPSTCNPLFTREEYDNAKREMSEDEFAQEILAQFREIGKGKVYLNHGPHNRVEQNPFALPGQRWTPHLPIVVGADFNVGLMAWELGQSKGEAIHFGDEIAVENTNTYECAQILCDRVKGHKSGITIIGDASGKARNSKATETDYQIIVGALREAGHTVVRNLTPDSNPPVRDRVNVMNWCMRSSDGSVRLTYDHKRCLYLRKDCERVSWKEGAQSVEFDKSSDPKLTHSSDAAGYPTYHYGNSWRPKVGKMRVMVRC
jgi:hypothetical protein